MSPRYYSASEGGLEDDAQAYVDLAQLTQAASERAVYTREDFASFLDQDLADRRAWAESPESYYGVGRTFL